MNILVTGAAGFIGYHIISDLIKNKKNNIYGIDNLLVDENSSYKKKRLQELKNNKNFFFHKIDIRSFNKLEKLFQNNSINYIINLAAVAGVRKSLNDPELYFDINVQGYMNILLLSKKYSIKHLVHASSSSVYGNCKKFPQKEEYSNDKQTSFYGTSKKINENMSSIFSENYNIKITCLRFFTVYGPYSRKDMAIYKFVNSAINNKKILLYNNGNHYRDFTFVSDIVDLTIKVLFSNNKNKTNFNVFNIGSGKSIKLQYLLNIIEKKLNKKIKINNIKLQQGDAIKTHSSIVKIKNYLKIKTTSTSVEKGIEKYIDWYKGFINE